MAEKFFSTFEETAEWVREYHEMARVYRAEIVNALPSGIEVFVHAAISGGPNVGYSFGGNFCVTLSAETYGIGSGTVPSIKRYIKGRDLEAARKMYDKKSQELRTFAQACKMVKIYRKMGIIPKSVAKRHANILRKEFPGEDMKHNPAVLTRLMRLFDKYMRNQAECPQCLKKKTFQETILGWSCGNCSHTLYDINDPEWMDYGAESHTGREITT